MLAKLAMMDAGMVYGILISIVFIGFIISLCISLYKNRRGLKLYTVLLRDDGRISKVSLAFLFIMPIIIYQAIYLHEITAGLDYILLTIFGTELGVKITDRLPGGMFGGGRFPRKGPRFGGGYSGGYNDHEYGFDDMTDDYNPYKGMSKKVR